MNIPKEVRLRTVVILLSSLLVLSSVSIYYAFSASTPTSGLTDIYIEPPMMESSYIIGIYASPSTCYLKNGTSGQITTTGTFATVLQYAINSLTTGGKIFIRAAQYSLTTAITIGGSSGLYFEGEGLGGVGTPAVQIDYALSDLGDTMITYGGVARAFLGGWKNIMFRGNSTLYSKGLNIQGWISDLFFEQCGFMYFDTGVVIQGGSTGVGTAKVWNIWFEQCLFEDNLGAGIYLTNTDNALIRMIDRVKISNCHFYNNRNSIYVAPDAPYVWHLSFIDNTVQAERNACINVSYGGSGRQWIISDNHIFDCGIGANGTMAAIMVNGSAAITYPDSWLIENNIIANHFTSAPVAMNNSIWLTGTVTNFVIQGNFFFQASEPIRIDGLTSYSSIKVNGNADYAKNLVFPSEARAYSYLIGAFKSSYYMLNCSSGNIDDQSTNASAIINNAMGNTTSLGGIVHLKSGTFIINNTLLLGNKVILEGEGENNTVLFMGNAANMNMINITGPTQFCGIRTLKMDGNKAQNTAGIGIRSIGTAGNRVADLVLEHLWIYNFKGNGMQPDDMWGHIYSFVAVESCDGSGLESGTVCTSGYVSNSRFASNNIGININAYWTTFLGCQIESNNHEGIIISGGAYDRIEGCQITYNSKAGAGSWDGFFLDATSVIVTGNHFYGGLTERYSLYVNGGNHVITSNYFLGDCVTGNAYFNPAIDCLVRSNLGYLTESAGAQVSCSNNTAVAHGLAGTPTSITLSLHGNTAYNTTMILRVPTVLSKNATHFRIEFTMWETVGWTQVAVSAVEAQTVYWQAEYIP